jgi:NADPH:quinone reductase
MQTALVTRFGTPEVLVTGEAPDPVAGPGEVVIDVAVADVLWVETMIRQGGGGEYFDMTPPYVPGNGVAGRVGAVADGVDPGWLGRRVVAHTGQGGYAERVVVRADRLSAVPDGLGLHEAAALLADGSTALALFEGMRIAPEDRGRPVLGARLAQRPLCGRRPRGGEASRREHARHRGRAAPGL